LPAMVYYARLAQKIINALSANTSEGVLFDIDMRLRPSGSAGPVATSFASFARYYQNDAWVWELQALTKARVVWAQNGFDETVSGCVRDILRRPRDKAVLTKEIGAMRDKIRASFPAKSAWDVKNADGGMIDIEFFAQYLQLLHAAAHPDILGRSVTNVLTAAARNALITKETAAGFIERYRMLRTVFAIKTLYGDDFKIKAASLYGYGDTSAFERDRLTASAVFVPTP